MRVVRSYGLGSNGGGGPTLFGATGIVAKKNRGTGGVTMSFSVISGIGQAPASVQTAADGTWSQVGFQAGTTYAVTPSLAGFRFSPRVREFSEGASDLNFKRKK
jgi:hypothetical protein